MYVNVRHLSLAVPGVYMTRGCGRGKVRMFRVAEDGREGEHMERRDRYTPLLNVSFDGGGKGGQNTWENDTVLLCVFGWR